MTTSAFTAGLTVKRGDGGSPSETFTTIEEVFSVSPIGKTNALIDATNYDSGGNREFIHGLADGAEISIECNYLPAATVQAALKGDVDNKTRRNLKVVLTDGTTTKNFTFACIPLSWNIAPSLDNKNVITFSVKVTGAITVS
jgi:hypothetical protein